MSLAQDPFYIVKEEIQGSIDKLLLTFDKWKEISSDTGKKVQLRKALLTDCESIQWQVDELDKTISVAARNPTFYGIDKGEIDRRQKWTKNTHDKVGTVMMAVGKGVGYQNIFNVDGTQQNLRYQQKASSSDYAQENDDFLSSESDKQLLLMKEQDQELDDLSASVQRIGHVGLTIHNELIEQERIMDDLGAEIDSATNRLDFVQKKIGFMMKKAGVKGQFMMILFLLILFIVLFALVFIT